MKLVEIIPAFDTAESTVAAATRLAEGIGKTPIRVKDVTGFAVNRILTAFFIEAVKLRRGGRRHARRSRPRLPPGARPSGGAVRADGRRQHRRLALEVTEILHAAYGERFHPPALMKQMVKAGRIGRKAGTGWRSDASGRRR